MKFLHCTTFLAIYLASVLAEKKGYEDYQVYETEILNHESALLLQSLQLHHTGISFWREAVNGYQAKIMAGPESKKILENYLNENEISSRIVIEDVQSLIDLSEPKSQRAECKVSTDTFDWCDYHSHDEINTFLEEMAEKHSFVTIESAGQSYEGRDLKVLRINKAGPEAPVVFIEAGIHAREWISPAVATYTVQELLENYRAHPKYVDNLNFVILPVFNPDGYQYTRTDDRLWRKNRAPNGSPIGCVGTDLNRNWHAEHWAESGVSFKPCSETYPGAHVYSEVENQNIKAYFDALSPQPTMTMSYHSAAEILLYPYAYGFDAYPENIDEIIELCEQAADALNSVHGQNFICNSVPLAFGPSAGGSPDYYAQTGVRFVHTPELRDNGFGFILPPEYIIPSGEEFWAAWEVFLGKLLEEVEEK